MGMEVIRLEWGVKLTFLQRVSLTQGWPEPFRQRKFILCRFDDELKLVVGPEFAHIAEYHHFALRGYISRCRSVLIEEDLGCGVLEPYLDDQDSGRQVSLCFWKDLICGEYGGELDQCLDDLRNQLSAGISIVS